VGLAAVDEGGVGAEGDVVEKQLFSHPADVDPPLVAAEGRQRCQRIRAVEAEVAGKVIPSPERNTNKWQFSLDCDLRDRRQRAVASRDPEGPGAGARSHEGRGIVVLTEDARLDSSLTRSRGKLVSVRSPAPRAWVDQEKARQTG
jgi:hypothetical protein